MIPVWTLKLGSVAVTLASTAGFWHHVTLHVKPVKAPLKPAVVKVQEEAVPVDDDSEFRKAMDRPAVPVPSQQVVQRQATVGARWLTNSTGMKPVTNTYVS